MRGRSIIVLFALLCVAGGASADPSRQAPTQFAIQATIPRGGFVWMITRGSIIAQIDPAAHVLKGALQPAPGTFAGRRIRYGAGSLAVRCCGSRRRNEWPFVSIRVIPDWTLAAGRSPGMGFDSQSNIERDDMA